MKTLISTIVCLFALCFGAQAATFTAVTDGNWNSGATWGNAGNVEGTDYPGPSDLAVVSPTAFGVISVTVSADQTVDSLHLDGSSGGFAIVSVASGITLTVSTGLQLTQTAVAFPANVGIGYLTIIGTGVLDVVNIHSNTVADDKCTIEMFGAGTINVSGFIDIGSFGDLTPGSSGTVNFDGTAAQTIPLTSEFSYHNLTTNNTSATGVSPEANITSTLVTGDILVQSGIFNNATFSFTGTGSNNFTIRDGATLEIRSGNNFPTNFTMVFDENSTVLYSASGAQNVSAQDYSNLTIDGSGTKTMQGNCSVDNILTISAGTLDANGNTMTLQSSAARTARFAALGSGAAYSGTMTVERFLNVDVVDWIELSSPVQGTDLDDWEDDGLVMTGFTGSDFPSSTFVSVYSYDETANNANAIDGWDAATNTTQTTGPTMGYNTFAGNQTITLSVSGTPYTGDQQIDLSFTNSGDADEAGWNLIGNPYACTVDWDAVAGANKVNIYDVIFAYSATAGSYGAYQGGTGGVTTNNVNNLIPSSQGFWVHANATSASVTFEEDDKVTDDRAFIKSNTIPANIFKVKLTSDQNTYQDEAAMVFKTNALNDYDEFEDVAKFFGRNWAAPRLSAYSEDGVEVMINTLNANEVSYVVPLKTIAGWDLSGNYTLSFENLDELGDFDCVFLRDLELDTTIDLNATSDYTFFLDYTADDIRFDLHLYRFTDDNCEPMILNDDDISLGDETGTDSVIIDPDTSFISVGSMDQFRGFTVLQDGREVYLSFDFPQTTEAQISVLNSLGQQVSAVQRVSMSQGRVPIRIADPATAVYILRVESEGETFTKRFVY